MELLNTNWVWGYVPRWGAGSIVIIGVLGSLVRLLWGWVVMSLVSSEC